MVDLPTVPRRLALSEAPRSLVTAGDIAAPYADLAKGLDRLGDALGDASVVMAEQAAEKAVTRDENGVLQVSTMPPMTGRAGRVYNRIAQQRYLTDIAPEIAAKDTEARIKHEGNPAGYAAWAKTYGETLASNQPNAELQNAVRGLVERRTTETANGLALRQSARATQGAEESIGLRQTEIENELGALQRGGDNGSDAFKSRMADWVALANERVANPLFGYTPDRAAYDQKRLAGKLTGGRMLFETSEIYKDQSADESGQPRGGAQKALKFAEKILTDPTINLSEAERFGYFHKATAEVRALEAERKQDLSEAKLAMTSALSAVTQGVTLGPELEQSIIQNLRKSGGVAEAASFSAAMVRSRFLDTFNQTPLDQMPRVINTLKVGPPPQIGGLAPRAQAVWSDNATALRQRGIAVTVSSGHRDPEHNEAVGGAKGSQHITGNAIDIPLKGMTDEEKRAVVGQFLSDPRVGGFGYYPNSDSIHVDMRPGVRAAWGTSKSADSIGKGWPDWMTQGVRQWQGGPPSAPDAPGGPVAVAAAPGVDLRLLTDAQKLAKGKARDAWQAVTKDLDAGLRPADAVINKVVEIARATNDHDLLDTISARVKRFDTVQERGQLPLPEQQAGNIEGRRAGAEGELSPGQSALLKDLEARQNAITSGLRDNPISTTVGAFSDRLKTPVPLDTSSSEALQAGLRYRARIAQFAAESWKVPVPHALDQADLMALQGAIQGSDTEAKVRIFSDMATALPENVRQATFAKLGEKGPAAMTFAYAGSLFGQVPDVAIGIMQGMKAIEADKRFDPTAAEKSKKAFNEVFDTALPATAFGVGARTSDIGALSTMRSAARALYAFRSAQAGDTTGTVSEERLRTAINDVTGGVLQHNGGAIIAPGRGVPQRQFDRIMWGITDSDLAGVTTLSGTPVTADYLRRTARLESVGDGRYLVQLGRDQGRPIYAFSNASEIHAPAPLPYVLDLRGRKEGTPPITLDVGHFREAR